MRIAVCDDQDMCIDDIILHINRYEEKIEKKFYIDRYKDPKELLESLKQVNYNLIYLDIEMEDENGIHIAEQIKEVKPNCMVIFVTAYMKYFHDSFHVSAFQYITKPIQEDLFEFELERAYKTFKAMNKSIVFPTTHGNLVLHFHDIVYIETSYREYKVHCLDGYHYGSVKAYQKMKTVLSRYNFFKIQRSFLVNLDHIKEFNGDELVMSNGDRLIVSRKQFKKFKQAFFSYLDN